MEVAELRLRIVYGVDRATNELRVCGSARHDTNSVNLTFGDGVLGQLAAGVLRPFLLVADDLAAWPELPPDLMQRPLETRIWANPKGKRKDHRPLIWEGWPARPDLVVLRPAVKVETLDRYEPKQSGFVLRLHISCEACAATGCGLCRGLGYTIAPPPPKYERISENDDTELDTGGEGASQGGGSSPGEDPDPGQAREGGAASRSDDSSLGGREPRASGDAERAVDGDVWAGHPAADQRGGGGGDASAAAPDEGSGDGADHGAEAIEEDDTGAGGVHAEREAPVGETWGVQVAWIREQRAQGATSAGMAVQLGLPIEHVRYALEPQSWERDKVGGYVGVECPVCQGPVTLTSSGYPMCPNKHVAGHLCESCGQTMKCEGWYAPNEHGNPPKPKLVCERCAAPAPEEDEEPIEFGDEDLLAAEPFCGAGGLSLGLDRAGFAHIWAGDKNKHAVATYRAAFPDVPTLKVAVTGDEELPIEPGRLDLIAAGPPCQPFSNAGDKKGEWDPRDGFPALLKLVERYQPKAILIENVKGLMQKRHLHYVEAVVASLMRAGYCVKRRVLQAADFGVPQRRERVFFVCFRDGAANARFRWPEPTHSVEALVWRKYIKRYAPDGTPTYLDDPEGRPLHDPEDVTRCESAALTLFQKYAQHEPGKGTKVRERWEAAHEARKLLPWVTVREALGELVREFVPGETTHKPPVRGRLDAELVDVGRGGEAMYDSGTSRHKSLLYKNTQPDVPADTISAAAEQKGSEHCARIALVTRTGHAYTEKIEGLDTPINTLTTVPKNNPQIMIQDRGGWGHGAREGKLRDTTIDIPASAVLAQWAKDVPKFVVRNLGAGDGLGARLDDVAPTVPADAAGQSGLAAMDASEMHEWTGSEGTTEPGRVHRRPSVVLRRLSHEEVARLQSFPDDWPWQGPSTQVYRQIGNAVPPLLAQRLGESIAAALQEPDQQELPLKRKKKPRALA